MPIHRLDNYLKTYRKRAGLSQGELAYLLGAEDGTSASRYERFGRKPSLATALAFEAIFETPIKELFAGLYQEAEALTVRRAKLLHKRLQNENGCPDAKLKLLTNLAERERSQRDAAAWRA
jgi:transcriptional regulator with XRE-family HTH domain